MSCPSQDQINEQSKASSVEPWFTLHLLVCEECCDKFQIAVIIRREAAKLRGHPDDVWELVDPIPRDWMLWMTGDRFPDSDTSQ